MALNSNIDFTSLTEDMDLLRHSVYASMMEFIKKYDGKIIPEIEIETTERTLSFGRVSKHVTVNIKAIIKT